MNIVEKRLTDILAQNWWVLLLRGLAAIAFGVLVWVQPGISLAALILVFGAYTLADGILGVWTAIAGRKEHEHWWVLFLGALISIGVGLVAFTAPGVTALALLFYIAIWAIGTGVLQIVAAIRLRKEIVGEWYLVLSGLVSVVLGVLLMARPGAGVLAVLTVIGTCAIIFGVLLALLSFKVRKLGSANKHGSEDTHAGSAGHLARP